MSNTRRDSITCRNCGNADAIRVSDFLPYRSRAGTVELQRAKTWCPACRCGAIVIAAPFTTDRLVTVAVRTPGARAPFVLIRASFRMISKLIKELPGTPDAIVEVEADGSTSPWDVRLARRNPHAHEELSARIVARSL